MTETDRFMLIFCAIACRKTNLSQRIIKTAIFGCLCQADVVAIAPICTLFNVTYHQATTYIRYPISKNNVLYCHCLTLIGPLSNSMCGFRPLAFLVFYDANELLLASRFGTAAEGSTSSCSICLLMPSF